MTFFLVELHKNSAVNNKTQFRDAALSIDIGEVKAGYLDLVRNGPNRNNKRIEYFIDDHRGILKVGKISNRREEHRAMAIVNASRDGSSFFLPDGRKFKFFDYQFPLYDEKEAGGIGKVDLIGFIEGKILTVIELKILGPKGEIRDTPLKALLEGLTYCAVIESNMVPISREAERKFNLHIEGSKPALAIMAPHNYWFGYLNDPHSKTKNWADAIKNLSEKISSQLNLQINFFSLEDCEHEYDIDSNRNLPFLTGNCKIVSVPGLP